MKVRPRGGRRRRGSIWVWNSFYERRSEGGWTAWVEPLGDEDEPTVELLVSSSTPHGARKELLRQLERTMRELPQPEAESFRSTYARLYPVGAMPPIQWPPTSTFHSIMQMQSRAANGTGRTGAAARLDDVAVSLQHVSKNYGPVEALQGVSIDIPKGQVVALLGPNGAGKTTAISLMLGLRRPTKGSVALFGRSPRSLAARSRCGVMLQESGLPATLRVREVVELFRSYYPAPLDTDEVLHVAGIAHKARSLVTRLSGGERQRLYFALAICGDPEMLFLDEPTAGLDVEGRQAFLASVRAYAVLGKTVLLTTHYLEEADAVADRIIVVNHGRVIADGTPSEIKAGFGKKRVQFRSAAPVPELAFCDLPVACLELNGNAVRFLSDAPEVAVRTLFERGIDIQELEVSSAGLQEAFLALVDSGTTKGQSVA